MTNTNKHDTEPAKRAYWEPKRLSHGYANHHQSTIYHWRLLIKKPHLVNRTKFENTCTKTILQIPKKQCDNTLS